MSARNRELFGLVPAALLVTGGFTAVLLTRVSNVHDATLTYGAAGSFRRGHDVAEFDVAGSERYDRILSTLPNDVMLGVAGHLLADDYRRRADPQDRTVMPGTGMDRRPHPG